MNTSPTINQLMKAIPSTIDRPEGAEWGERFDEAEALLNSSKIDLAESKFQSLRRTLPNEPAVLSGLLSCAIWRGDTDAQSELLRKLSTCQSLDEDERIRFRAMSALVDPESPEISVPVVTLESELANTEEAELSLMSDARLAALPANVLSSMRISEDEVPPRSAFQVLDRDKPASLDSLPPLNEVPEAIALLFLYGKQTDRAARIEAHDIKRSHAEVVRNKLQSLIPGLELKETPGETLPLLAACQPQVAMIHYKAKPADAEKLQAELLKARMASAIAATEIPLLHGKSLISAADDASLKFERTVAIRMIEQYDAVAARGDEIVSELYSLSKLQRPPVLHPESNEVETLSNDDLNRVDGSKLDANALTYLLQRAQQISATPAMRRFATQLIGMQLSADELPAKLFAYMSLVNSSEHPSEALAHLEQAKAFAESINQSTANLLLTEVGLRLALGDAAGFQKVIETLSTRYGREPEVMARLQQMLMSYGFISPDGTPRSGRSAPSPAEVAPAGQLWTPDQPAQAAQGSGSKLWIPGMD
jgi:hypothetical protein